MIPILLIELKNSLLIKSFFKYFCSVILLSLFFQQSLQCGDSTKVQNQVRRTDFIRNLHFMIGYPMLMETTGFYDDYNNLIRNDKYAKSILFNNTPIITLGTKFDISSTLKINICADWIDSKFSEVLVQNFDAFNNHESRTLTETIEISTIPLTVSVEYHEVQSKYQNYVGCGLGASLGRTSWDESVYSTLATDNRQSGNRLSIKKFDPVIKIYAGVELDFDNVNKNSFLNSFIMEVNFHYIFRNVKMFEGFENQFINSQFSFDKNYTILPAYIGLYLGLNFNLNTGNPADKLIDAGL